MKKYKIKDKAWGYEKWIVNNKKYCMKFLYLNEGYRCSLHKHLEKDETFYIQEGIVLMYAGSNTNGTHTVMKPGDSVRIKPKDVHSFAGITDATIIEVSTTHKDEDSHRYSESGDWDWKIK